MLTARSVAALLGGLAGIASACETADPDPSLALRDPARPGPWEVGVTTLTLPDGAGPGSSLTVEVWYPAQLPEGAATDVQFGIDTLAVRNAEADLRGAPFPVIAFSHGNAGIRFQSVYLTRHLASHGYVVLAPDHVRNTLFDDDPDRRAEVLMRRPRDLKNSVDELFARSAAPGALLEGLAGVDETRLGVSGHSFGGFTTLVTAGAAIDLAALAVTCAADPGALVCSGSEALTPEGITDLADPRVRAALVLAPGGRAAFGAAGLAAVTVPIQVQGGTLDGLTTPDAEVTPIFDGLPAPRLLAMLEGAGHFSFTDICPLYELLAGPNNPLEFLATEGCGTNTIPIERAHAASRTLATAFFDRELKGLADEHGYTDPARGVADVLLIE